MALVMLPDKITSKTTCNKLLYKTYHGVDWYRGITPKTTDYNVIMVCLSE